MTWFSRLKLHFELRAVFIFLVLYGTNKILRAIDLLFNSKFLQYFCCFGGKSISFELYWSIKGLISDILWGSFLLFFYNLMQRLKHIENNYYHYFLDLLLLFYFLSIQGNLHMIHLFFLGLFYEVDNIINQHYQKQIRFLSLILLAFLDIFVKEI